MVHPAYYSGPTPGHLNGVFKSNFAFQANGDQELITHSKVPTLHQTDNLINILSVVTKTADTAQLTINGASPQAKWQPFTGDNSWSFLNERVSLGIHNVQSPKGFHGYFYTSAPYSPDSIYPNYGFVLTEYAPWPTDSFQAYIGQEPKNLYSFEILADSTLSLCANSPIYLKAPPMRNTRWQWFLNDSLVLEQKAGEEAAPLVPLWISQGGFYTLSLRDADGCESERKVEIFITALAVPRINAQASQTCAGSILSLSLDNPGDFDQSSWLLGEQEWEGAETQFNFQPRNDSVAFTLALVNANCADTIQYQRSLEELGLIPSVIPNVLTPNGYGINDNWCFNAFQEFESCFEVTIANRWGQQVFRAYDPTQCWTPKISTTGVYFYTLRYGNEQKKGSVTVFSNR